MADRVITWALSTQYRNGLYNSTIRLDSIQPIFDLFGRYWQCAFTRVTRNARINITQSDRALGRNVFATARGNTINLDPLANYGKSVYTTAIVLLHEFGHLAGGSSHNSDPAGLLSFNGGSSGGWMPSDARWFRAYQLRGAFPPPGIIRATFANVSSFGVSEPAIPLAFGCKHNWFDWIYRHQAP
jgi:hypothetical protein